jgi:hypothetical protein
MRLSGEADIFVGISVPPEDSVAAADCAAAGGGRVRDPVEGPTNRAAMAGTFEHERLLGVVLTEAVYLVTR